MMRAALLSMLIAVSGCFAKEWRPCHSMSLNGPTTFQKCFEWLTGPMGGQARTIDGVSGCSGNCDCLDDPFWRAPHGPELIRPVRKEDLWTKVSLDKMGVSK